MNRLIRLYLLLSLLLNVFINGQAPEILVHPVSINTTEGSVVEFTCVASNNPSTIGFVVDGGPPDPSEGFDELPAVLFGGGNVSLTLRVTASAAINNSMIFCQAINVALMGENSDTAILRVQGPLSSVVDLSYSFINSSTVNISWSPPFTLPGTDITGYNISATSNGTTTNYFTSNSYYQQLSMCVEFNVTVSGYNGLDGESCSILVPSAEVLVSVYVSITNDLKLIISTNFTDSCSDQLELSISITVLSDDNVITFPAPSGIIDIVNYNTAFTVAEDTTYTVTVSYSLCNGCYTVNGSTSIDTYGVESLSYTTNTTDGNVTVTCYFNSFSTDTACTVQLVQYGIVQYNAMFNRTGDIAQGSISGVVTGVYDILAYDQGSSVLAASLKNVIVFGSLPFITNTTDTIIGKTWSLTPSLSLTPSVPNLLPSSDSITTSEEIASKSPPIDDTITVIIVNVVLLVVLIILITIVVILLMYCSYIKRKDLIDHVENKPSTSTLDVPVARNPSYIELQGRQQANHSNDMVPMKRNYAYKEV